MRITTATVVFENGKSIEVEVVRTARDQERGLAGHALLDDQHGMLFVWDDASERTFWMKGVAFPIDILWIQNGRIIGIEKNVPVASAEDTALPTYVSPGSVEMVLEVAAGFSDQQMVEVGQRLDVDF